MANPPQELNSPASSMKGSKKPKLPEETLKQFLSLHPNSAFSMNFGNVAKLAYLRPDRHYSVHQRLFCGLDEIYCLFLGSLHNLCTLKKQYGLTSKGINEAMFVIEAYRTLRDRGPYPADQVVKDLEGSFAFIIFDNKAKTVFVALGSDGGVKLFWGIAADGSVVISDDLEVIKGSCAKSYAPFPTGCMFHSDGGLVNYEHPINKMKPMPRVDSEGVMCGANFNVDAYSRINSMPRVGSEANWSTWDSSH
ncbi:protein of unknown function DUF3700 [Macleaya cordata]|uniref:DUF3700 domain-containing protein n=1 Tax=Macleaya cordata TaxID=56857 RepID=A0A200QS21_MACCD|nr:protein of unknown function DUF3700 [Macleaya cordata]